jgi:hypothetical protein
VPIDSNSSLRLKKMSVVAANLTTVPALALGKFVKLPKADLGLINNEKEAKDAVDDSVRQIGAFLANRFRVYLQDVTKITYIQVFLEKKTTKQNKSQSSWLSSILDPEVKQALSEIVTVYRDKYLEIQGCKNKAKARWDTRVQCAYATLVVCAWDLNYTTEQGPIRMQLPLEAVKTYDKERFKHVCDHLTSLLEPDSELSSLSGESDWSESEQSRSKCATTMSRLTGQSATNTNQANLAMIALMEKEKMMALKENFEMIAMIKKLKGGSLLDEEEKALAIFLESQQQEEEAEAMAEAGEGAGASTGGSVSIEDGLSAGGVGPGGTVSIKSGGEGMSGTSTGGSVSIEGGLSAGGVGPGGTVSIESCEGVCTLLRLVVMS